MIYHVIWNRRDGIDLSHTACEVLDAAVHTPQCFSAPSSCTLWHWLDRVNSFCPEENLLAKRFTTLKRPLSCTSTTTESASLKEGSTPAAFDRTMENDSTGEQLE